MLLGAIPSPSYWSVAGVEMAYALFLIRKRVCDFMRLAKRSALWKSPSEHEPSPQKVATMFGELSNLWAYPAPAACGTCVVNGELTFINYLSAAA